MTKRRLLKFATFLVVPPIYIVALASYLVSYGQKENSQKSDAIIIFGARVNSRGLASPILHARTRKAYELWKSGLAPKIVCTGGVGTYPPAEASVQKQLLEKWGVPEKAILLDERSTSTHENAVNAAALLPKGAKVIAVSEAFHLWRCQRECSNQGLDVSVAAEEPGWEQLRPRQKAFYALREAILVTRDLLTFRN